MPGCDSNPVQTTGLEICATPQSRSLLRAKGPVPYQPREKRGTSAALGFIGKIYDISPNGANHGWYVAGPSALMN